jgi:hypothetical protein
VYLELELRVIIFRLFHLDGLLGSALLAAETVVNFLDLGDLFGTEGIII